MGAVEPIRVERRVPLQSSPEALWPLLSNTDRLNRALGLPEHRPERPDQADHSRMVSARLGPLTLRWRERPFSYARERFFRNAREFVGGPIKRYEGGIRLEDGVAVVDSEFEPRWAAAAPFVRLAATKATDDMAALVAKFDRMMSGGGGAFPPRLITPPNAVLLDARAADLRRDAVDARAAERLVEALRSAPDDEVARARPFELADRWGLPRDAVLDACLHAVRAGLLDLRWEILCPNCGAPEAHGALAQVGASAHCPTCAIEYSTAGADSVELRVAPHPSVRAVVAATYCAGSPARSPHAEAQLPVPPGATASIETVLRPRSYALRALNAARVAVLRPREDGPSELRVDLETLGDGGELSFRPGPVRVVARAGAEELVRLEPEDYKDSAATAGHVTATPEFRRLFSAEVLAPGVRVGVKRLALLFTDLKGSTAMYEKVGDAAAYGIVREHFDYLFALIAARGGAVVKTIGDAVMAVFPDAGAALECALDMQERIGELNAKLAPRPPVALKIGVHEGPAIAVGAGGVNDYFGTTANVAARVQNESVGGDVVISRAVVDDPEAAAVLARRAPSAEDFDCELKGLSDAFRLRRLRPK